MSKAELKQKGFTIIEVVLVLAIAALIFLMVFIALPALQRNQRDQARKTFQSKVSAAVTTYQSNKRGELPKLGRDLNGYIDGVQAGNQPSTDNTSKQPLINATPSDSYSENQYIVKVTSGFGGDLARTDVVHVHTSAKCNKTGDAAILGTGRQAAILMRMENGGQAVCQEV